ncbi:hypothetical protein [Streptomyces sp. NPDC049040]|uniref:hypothetical protein n=1 Tax=Streptomyces sp. NPDC049040 TaxID=3365593 RepID=UPI003719C8E2
MADIDQSTDPHADPTAFADRYIAVWNEPDPGARRKAVEELWGEDALQVLQPPEEMREAAAKVGMRTVVLEARGHDALEFRVRTSYEEFVAPGASRFRVRGDVQRLHDVVRFSWEWAPVDGGAAQGGGLEVLLLGPDGRIATDYQFIGL